MCVWRETASEGCETRETRDLHCHVCFRLGLLCERLSLVTVLVTRLRVSKFYVHSIYDDAADSQIRRKKLRSFHDVPDEGGSYQGGRALRCG